MSYRANALEWLALGAIAQQPDESLRMYSLRIYLRECVGVARPLALIRDMVRGGLLHSTAGSPVLTLTEWGAAARRAPSSTRLPAWLPIPGHFATRRLSDR